MLLNVPFLTVRTPMINLTSKQMCLRTNLSFLTIESITYNSTLVACAQIVPVIVPITLLLESG
jgi:hypothetical protein